MREYTKSHEWYESLDGDKNVVTIGITKAAVSEVGDIVYVELPVVGKAVKAGQEACVIESTKAAVDIASPVSGTIIATNKALQSDISLLNRAPEAEGWLFQVQL